MATAPRRPLIPFAGLVVLGIATSAAFYLGYRTHKPARIIGPSMAETLLGKHGELECAECQFTFRFDAEDVPIPNRLVCPNCGHVHAGDSRIRILPGDLVHIDARALSKRALRRFDFVAFDVPGEKDMLGVKRVVGLPGETVAIRGGEIYVGGVMLQKRDYHERAVLVQDSGHSRLSRWQEQSPSNVWRHVITGDVNETATSEAFGPRSFLATERQPREDFAWLTYRHIPTIDLPAAALSPQPIRDFDAYNSGLSRELNDVFDLQLRCNIQLLEPDTVVAMRLHDGWEWWQATFDKKAGQLRLNRSDQLIATEELPALFGDDVVDSAGPGSNVIFVLNDDEVIVRVFSDTSVFMRQRMPNRTSKRAARDEQIALGLLRGEAQIRGIQIYRDIYYLDPAGLSRPWQMDAPLGPDQYFLLGDNPPASTDSRHFGGVKREQIRGYVRKLESP